MGLKRRGHFAVSELSVVFDLEVRQLDATQALEELLSDRLDPSRLATEMYPNLANLPMPIFLPISLL
jgi:hypothetical protein